MSKNWTRLSKRSGRKFGGRQYRFDKRIGHPVCAGKPSGGKVAIIPITSSPTEASHKHVRLPKPIKAFSKRHGKERPKVSYAVRRVIIEKEEKLSKPFISKMGRENNSAFRKIYKRYRKKKS